MAGCTRGSVDRPVSPGPCPVLDHSDESSRISAVSRPFPAGDVSRETTPDPAWGIGAAEDGDAPAVRPLVSISGGCPPYGGRGRCRAAPLAAQALAVLAREPDARPLGFGTLARTPPARSPVRAPEAGRHQRRRSWRRHGVSLAAGSGSSPPGRPAMLYRLVLTGWRPPWPSRLSRAYWAEVDSTMPGCPVPGWSVLLVCALPGGAELGGPEPSWTGLAAGCPARRRCPAARIRPAVGW
jgi:hypothetical protein